MTLSFLAVLGLGALGALALLIAYRRGFFIWPANRSTWPEPPITLPILFLPFALYFAVQFGVVTLFSPLFSTLAPERVLPVLSWLNFFIHFLLFFGLATVLHYLPRIISSSLLLRRTPFQPKHDLLIAACAYVISLPLLAFVNDIANWILYFAYGPLDLPDQLAVQFLKMTLGKPGYFFLATTTIVIFAPMIEECLFRGFLQSFLRRHLGTGKAIALTSLAFSLFHYSFAQGVSNLPIIASLFVLAVFLGFVYERQGSLFASISLHALFNLVSVIDLAFFS